jgi:import inner membrane translocase subunit TIM16
VSCYINLLGAGGRATAEQMTAESNKSWGSKIMPPDEAYKVLNIDLKEIGTNQPVQEIISENYKRLFRCNDVTQGGSFYLQSKIFRAKQTLDRIHPPTKSTPSSTASSTQSSQQSASQSG